MLDCLWQGNTVIAGIHKGKSFIKAVLHRGYTAYVG